MLIMLRMKNLLLKRLKKAKLFLKAFLTAGAFK
jgi:hypothetical protein